VLVYLSDLAPVVAAIARVTEPGGLFAFTVETHDGDGVMLGEKLRYSHGEAHVRHALARAGMKPRHLAPDSTRNENNRPVPGLVVVADRSRSAENTPSSFGARATRGTRNPDATQNVHLDSGFVGFADAPE
jgi:hypothetical protein